MTLFAPNTPLPTPRAFRPLIKAGCAVLIGTCLIVPALTSPAIASIPSSSAKAYKPPADNRPPRGPFIPGARRTGCQGLLHNGLTAIAPQQQVGRTLSTQPTLTWFVKDDTTYRMELQLYEYRQDEWVKLSEVDLGQSQQGYSSYTLPETMPLTVGSLYRWNIIMVCDPARPSRNKVNVAQFEVVSPPVGLDVFASSPEDAAQQYAAAGLWYDAIALLVPDQPVPNQPVPNQPVPNQLGPNQLVSNPPLTPVAINYRKTLLQGLAETESPELSAQLLSIASEE